jgi:hypothetical protein
VNIDLIIEALEAALEMEFLCEYCGHGCISAGKKCKVDQKIKAALAEARKMKEPCVWCQFVVDTDGDNKFYAYKTTCGNATFGLDTVRPYCPCCGRKVKYED